MKQTLLKIENVKFSVFFPAENERSLLIYWLPWNTSHDETDVCQQCSFLEEYWIYLQCNSKLDAARQPSLHFMHLCILFKAEYHQRNLLLSSLTLLPKEKHWVKQWLNILYWLDYSSTQRHFPFFLPHIATSSLKMGHCTLKLFKNSNIFFQSLKSLYLMN